MAALLGEPWGCSMEQIAELTDRQLLQLYGHARDDKGRVQLADKAAGVSMCDHTPMERGGEAEARIFFGGSKRFGVTREKAEAEWLAKRGTLPDTPWYKALCKNWN